LQAVELSEQQLPDQPSPAMTQRTTGRSPGLLLDASTPREYDVFQLPPTCSSFNGGNDPSEASNNYESEDDGRRGRDTEDTRATSRLTASDIAQRALHELDDLFGDIYGNQRVRSDSQSESDVESSDGGREEVGISLEEMTIALNAAIDRHRPALNNEKSRRQTHRRRYGGVKADVDDDSAGSIPPEVALPIAHFQDVLQQRIKTFQATKQTELSPVPTSDTLRQPWERQWHRTNSSHPPPTTSSALSLDGSRLSISSRSSASISDSECAASSMSSENLFAVAKRVEMLDQQQQTSRVWMTNQATDTSSLLDTFSPGSRQQAQPDSTAKEVLYQPSSISLSALSERKLPSEQSIKTNRREPAPEDLASSHPSRPNSVVALWVESELSSSTSSHSPSLSRSSLSSASSVSTTSKHQSHSSSRTSNYKPKHTRKSEAQLSYLGIQVQIVCLLAPATSHTDSHKKLFCMC
jgi:hypothetical protein